MSSIGIADTDIHCHGQAKLQCLSNAVIQALHQLRGPGEAVLPGRSQLHGQDRTAACDSPVASAAGPAIARRNAENPGAMAAYVPARHQGVTLRLRLCRQRFVDLLSRIFRTDTVALRRSAWYRLIPQRHNPRCTILISKIRVGVIHPRIQQRHQHALPVQAILPALHRCNAGSCLSLIYREKQPLWFFDIFYFRNACQKLHQIFRHKQHCIFIQKLRHRNASLLKLIQRPGIFHNQLPGFFRTVEAYVQIFRAGALLWGGVQGQVQYIFYGGIVH